MDEEQKYNAVDFSDLPTAEDGKTILYNGEQVCQSEKTLGEIIDDKILEKGFSAGTDLKIENNVISVNTDGTIANSANMSFVAGSGTFASGEGAFAVGLVTSAIGNNGAFAEGRGTLASADFSHAEGGFTKVLGSFSHAEGYGTNASGMYCHAEGGNTTAAGGWTHAEGKDTESLSDGSHSEGHSTHAKGAASHTEGCLTIASGSYTHAEGYKSIAYREAAHAEGNDTHAFYGPSHSEGAYTSANGVYSHAEGYSAIAGYAAHAEGINTTADGQGSHAEGYGTIASGQYAHAEGYQTIASNYYSHTEGCITSAIGYASHAEGDNTIASGDYSHAEGLFTIANAEGMHVGGKYNKTSANAFFVIGNGANENNRSDAFIIDTAGNTSAAGKLAISGISDVGAAITSIAAINTYEVVSGSTTADITNPTTKTIYLIKDTTVTGSDQYSEWICTNTATPTFVKIGDTSIDLTPYLTKTSADIDYQPKGDYVPLATYNTLTAKVQELETLLESYSGRWVLTPEIQGVVIGGRTYPTVKIGTQEWIAENLDWKYGCNIGGTNPMSEPNANYLDDDEATNGVNGTKYGLKYNGYCISEINNLLSNGWHVSTKSDWETLQSYLSTDGGKKLKSTTGWATNNGTDDYGFNGTPAGGNGGGVNYWADVTGTSKYSYSLNDTYYQDSIYYVGGYGLTERAYIRLVRDIT